MIPISTSIGYVYIHTNDNVSITTKHILPRNFLSYQSTSRSVNVFKVTLLKIVLPRDVSSVYYFFRKIYKMPPKGRARISRSSSAANRMAVSRAAETSEQRQVRLDNDRARHEISRATETPEHRQVRLDNDRARHEILRATEMLEQRQTRLSDQRTKHAAARTIETPEQTNVRLDNQRS
jgi:hypothetical protein